MCYRSILFFIAADAFQMAVEKGVYHFGDIAPAEAGAVAGAFDDVQADAYAGFF